MFVFSSLKHEVTLRAAVYQVRTELNRLINVGVCDKVRVSFKPTDFIFHLNSLYFKVDSNRKQRCSRNNLQNKTNETTNSECVFLIS